MNKILVIGSTNIDMIACVKHLPRPGETVGEARFMQSNGGKGANGAIASLSSVAKLRYRDSQDGISNTFSIVPKSLGPTPEERVENLVTMMDGYFTKGAHHLNVNVLNREMLEDAMEHPEKYPQLTIRVSGYAVNFVKLSREHQLEVISRSFHERM